MMKKLLINDGESIKAFDYSPALEGESKFWGDYVGTIENYTPLHDIILAYINKQVFDYVDYTEWGNSIHSVEFYIEDPYSLNLDSRVDWQEIDGDVYVRYTSENGNPTPWQYVQGVQW